MLNVLRMIVRRAPLLAMILFIWFVLTILSFVGRGRAYSNYSTEHGKLPGVSLVMRGIHDHVLPWSQKAGGRASKATAKAREAAEDHAGQDAAAPDSGSEAEAADDSQAKADKDKAADAAKEGESGKDKESGPPEAVRMTIPETSCSRVVPAKDYGVAEKSYLSPDDTVYNTDKDGFFAPNGIYYSFQEVDDKYFEDALMVGDSRTVGLYEYGDMADVTSFLARESASVYDLFEDNEKLIYTPKGGESSEKTIKSLLKKKQFRKIYISLGVNELGVPDTEDYYKAFRKAVEKVHYLQPGAIIYIQGIMHVSKNMSSTDSVYNNTAIVQRNTAIATLANGRDIFYIDMNEDLCDKNGDLKEELTGDGIHLKASACELWHKYLKEHAVVVPD